MRATINSWSGLRVALRNEAAVREELIALLLAVPLAFVVTEGAWKRVILIAVVLFLLLVELLNTAIERLADEITTTYRPGIGYVKDVGSAAVGIAMLIAATVWFAALLERLSVW